MDYYQLLEDTNKSLVILDKFCKKYSLKIVILYYLKLKEPPLKLIENKNIQEVAILNSLRDGCFFELYYQNHDDRSSKTTLFGIDIRNLYYYDLDKAFDVIKKIRTI